MSGTPDIDKVAGYIEQARRAGIKLLPPDVNEGEANFTVEGGAIRFGMAAIKTVTEAVVNCIITEREFNGKFKSLADFCGRLDTQKVPRRSLDNLIKCGAFDSIDKRRTALLASLDSAISAGFKRQLETRRGAINLFGEEELHETDAPLAAVEEKSPKEILEWEKETLGFYLSGHPLDTFREKISALTSSRDLNRKSNKRVKVGGIITSVRRVTTRKGDSMAFLTLEDFDGTIDVTLFPNAFYRTINVALPEEIVVVEGRVDNDGDTVQILADNVTAIEDYTADFWLMIPAQIDTPATVDALKKIFAEHAGDSRIFINRDGKWGRIQQKISDSPALREELKTLLGAENVRLY